MYANNSDRRVRARLADRQLCVMLAILVTLSGAIPSRVQAQELAALEAPPSVIRNITGPSEHLEITTNSSRILTLDKKIPRVMVANPELVAVTPLSANQVQISAKKAGVTQVNLWDEDGKIHTVDVYIYGDVRELEHAYKTQFPHSSIKVYRYSGSLVLAGFIDSPNHVGPIMRLAEDYSPKVINNIQVGGVQQVLLKVKIFEVSRTKLRELGVDLAYIGGDGSFAVSSISELLVRPQNPGFNSWIPSGRDTIAFGIVDGNDRFMGFLRALQQNNVAKLMAEPNLVAISGRAAKFNSGGKVAYVTSTNLGQVNIGWEEFGTSIDFVPIVLGNGNIRLEVRPSVSSVDPLLGVNVNGTVIPGFRDRYVDTGVEMKAGQTFALAGLIEQRSETVNRGWPFLADMPVIGFPFRRTRDESNEIELLIMVTPEFVDPIEACECACLPGMGSISPDNCELYCGGHVEVPNPCNNCGPQGCIPVHGHVPCCPNDPCNNGGCGPAGCAPGGGMNGPMPYEGQQMPMYQGPMYEGQQPMQSPMQDGRMLPTPAEPVRVGDPAHGQLMLPPAPTGASISRAGGPQLANGSPRTAQRPISPSAQPAAQPQFVRNPSKPFNPTWGDPARPQATATDGLIGPVGYDKE